MSLPPHPALQPTRRRLLQGTAALATLGPTAWARAQGEAWRIGQTAALTGPRPTNLPGGGGGGMPSGDAIEAELRRRAAGGR